MENHGSGSIVGSSQAPYVNQLANSYGLATNYFAISHPSLPNYVALTSGSTQGVGDDNGPSSHPLNVPSIFSQLPGGQSRSLQESMPSSCLKSDSGQYVLHHNPMAYYTNLGSDCGNFDVGFGASPDLSAAFTFITPNAIHDMLDGTIAQGDAFLSSYVPALMATPQYQAGNTAIFITWDEDENSGGSNKVPTIVVSPYTGAVTVATSYNHYSLLRTAEDLLGLPALGNAASASPMESAFGLTGSPPPPPSPPANTALPVVSGIAQQGQRLTASNGSWTNSPTAFAYQWEDCDSSGANCGSIAGATTSGYTLVSGDVGHTIRVVVIASNAGGQGAATSGQTATVTAASSSSRIQHVVWVVMENHGSGSIVGSSQAPYVNQLANTYGLATNYFAISHPSLPNYVASDEWEHSGGWRRQWSVQPSAECAVDLQSASGWAVALVAGEHAVELSEVGLGAVCAASQPDGLLHELGVGLRQLRCSVWCFA